MASILLSKANHKTTTAMVRQSDYLLCQHGSLVWIAEVKPSLDLDVERFTGAVEEIRKRGLSKIGRLLRALPGKAAAAQSVYSAPGWYATKG